MLHCLFFIYTFEAAILESLHQSLLNTMEDTPSTTTPSRNSTLTFREVTEENWRAVADLSLKDG